VGRGEGAVHVMVKRCRGHSTGVGRRDDTGWRAQVVGRKRGREGVGARREGTRAGGGEKQPLHGSMQKHNAAHTQVLSTTKRDLDGARAGAQEDTASHDVFIGPPLTIAPNPRAGVLLPIFPPSAHTHTPTHVSTSRRRTCTG